MSEVLIFVLPGGAGAAAAVAVARPQGPAGKSSSRSRSRVPGPVKRRRRSKARPPEVPESRARALWSNKTPGTSKPLARGCVAVSAVGAIHGFTELVSGRVYWPAVALARLAGVSAYVLHHRYRPVSWGCPGDWRLVGGVSFYGAHGLAVLAAALRSDGLDTGADRLVALRPGPVGRGWLCDWEEVCDE